AARFAGERARIDQARHGNEIAAVADDGCFRHALVQRVLARGENPAVADDDRADLVDCARGIDDAGVLEDGGGHARSPAFWPTRSASMTAMRTATPISTCSPMT